MDRRSTLARSPHAIPAGTVAEIKRLRRERLNGDAIAWHLGLGRLSALDPTPPVICYERKHPGELVHIDTKKLGRFVRPSHRVTGNRRD